MANKEIKSRCKPYEEVVGLFEDYGCKLLETNYINCKTPMEFICKCGERYKKALSDFKKTGCCKKCALEKRRLSQTFTIEQVAEIFEDNGCVLLESEYINANTTMKYICVCGNRSTTRLGDFRSGKRCKQCGLNKLGELFRRDYADVYKFFEDNECKLLETTYINGKVPMRYICICGNQSMICYDSFKAGNRCRKCATERTSGENHYKYNHEKTLEERLYERKYPEYFEWRKQVFERDSYTCQYCGSRDSGTFNAHHLDGYHWCKQRRTDVSNGVTLCETCHIDFHLVYGYGDNTESQYNKWVLTKRNQDAI